MPITFCVPTTSLLLDNPFIGNDSLLLGVPKATYFPGSTSPSLSLSSDTKVPAPTILVAFTKFAPGYQCLSHAGGPNWTQ